MAAERVWREGLPGLVALMATLVLGSVGLGACSSAATSLGNQFLAPLSVLPATDVVLETNLQLAHEGVAASSAGPGISGLSAGGASGSGVPIMSGPPTSPSVVSEASSRTGAAVVLTAFNPVDRHCLGILLLPTGATVLSQSSPGTYDFFFGPTTAGACASSTLITESTKPSSWAGNDPASSWPNS